MQVFEIHFNPKNKEDRIIDSFSCQPTNIYEKRLGNLYMAGELKQAMPQNARFLNNLAAVIQKEYYSAGLKKSCQQGLLDSLKKANEFLDAEVQRGNVSWLGNLNFSILSFNDFLLNFTKIGDMKILLIRNSELSDISQNLESQEAETHSLKIFGNIVTGKLAKNDKVIVLNKDIFSALTQEKGFLNQFTQISDEKGIKEILKRKKQNLAELSGICLFLIVTDESTSKQTLTFQQDMPKFSFRQTFIKPLPSFKFLKIKLPSLKLKIPKFPKIKFPKIKIVLSNPLKKIKIPKIARKKLILLLLLILTLLAFFFIFKGEKEVELQEAQQKISEAKAKIIMAESLLILEEENKAQALFQEAWDMIYPLTKTGMPLRDEAIPIKKSLEKYLK